MVYKTTALTTELRSANTTSENRTHISALKGLCPDRLDDGGGRGANSRHYLYKMKERKKKLVIANKREQKDSNLRFLDDGNQTVAKDIL